MDPLQLAYNEIRILQFKVAEYKTASEKATDPDEKTAYSTILAVHERKLATAQTAMVLNISTAMAVNNLSPK